MPLLSRRSERPGLVHCGGWCTAAPHPAATRRRAAAAPSARMRATLPKINLVRANCARLEARRDFHRGITCSPERPVLLRGRRLARPHSDLSADLQVVWSRWAARCRRRAPLCAPPPPPPLPAATACPPAAAAAAPPLSSPQPCTAPRWPPRPQVPQRSLWTPRSTHGWQL